MLNNLAAILTISPYYPFEDGTDQYNWFSTTIKSLNRTLYPWLIVSVHTPFYLTYSVSENSFLRKLALMCDKVASPPTRSSEQF